MLKLRDQTKVAWSGKHRPSLTGQGVCRRPVQNPPPVRIGVGETPESVIHAGKLGPPMMLAIIGGQSSQFRPLVDLYRCSGKAAGHALEKLRVGVHSIEFQADTTGEARETFRPAYRAAFGKIGRERGWAPPTRLQFDAQTSPIGASMVGDAEAVATKILAEHTVLGGLSKNTILLDNRALLHRQIIRAIELLVTEVAPAVKKELDSTGVPVRPVQSSCGGELPAGVFPFVKSPH